MSNLFNESKPLSKKEIVLGVIGLAGIVGWIMNIVKVFWLIGEPFNAVGVELVIRCACAFLPPIGAIAGFM